MFKIINELENFKEGISHVHLHTHLLLTIQKNY